MPAKLSVNVDHIATLRQARGERYPDPVAAAVLAEMAGAHGITVHLREDRRHIQDRDLRILRETVQTRLNLEMAATPEMARIAMEVKPDLVTLVPERRDEVTTEGGLDIERQTETLKAYIKNLRDAGLRVSVFIDAELDQVNAALRAGAQVVEIHTGRFCHAYGRSGEAAELQRVADAVKLARKLNFSVAAGHGLNYANIGPVAALEGIAEFNIGHAIVARAALAGMSVAVTGMLALIGHR